VFVFFLLRFKYRPPVIVLAGVVLMAVGVAVAHHIATGIVGAALVVIGAAVGATGKGRGHLPGGRDENPLATSRLTDSTDDARVRAEAARTGH
jgi:xanthosine utilization system XapX-like protein